MVLFKLTRYGIVQTEKKIRTNHWFRNFFPRIFDKKAMASKAIETSSQP